MIISGGDLSRSELFCREGDVSVRVNELSRGGVTTELVGVVPTKGVDFIVVGYNDGVGFTDFEELDVGIGVVTFVLEGEDLDGPEGIIDV